MTQDILSSFLTLPLPKERIALQPPQVRRQANLLVVDRQRQTITHSTVAQLPQWVQTNDLWVVNRSRVRQALTWLRKTTGGLVELLWLEQQKPQVWRVFGEISKLRPGQRLCGESGLIADVLSCQGHFAQLGVSEPLMEQWLALYGQPPLPPYIRKARKRRGLQVVQPEDQSAYQTVFADEVGSIAAPTAGLHFDLPLMNEMQQAGATFAEVILHVGAATFTEVKVDQIDQVRVGNEDAEIPEKTAQQLKEAVERKARIVVVGTTSLRTLEGLLPHRHEVKAQKGQVHLTIAPGYSLQWPDAFLTNFHLSETSLRLLVAAVAGPALALKAYQAAIADERYQFFSYGDAMLVV